MGNLYLVTALPGHGRGELGVGRHGRMVSGLLPQEEPRRWSWGEGDRTEDTPGT